MGFKNFLQENASAGSTSASSIASGDSRTARSEHRSADNDWHSTRDREKHDEKHYAGMREKISAAKEKSAAQKKKKGSFKSFLFGKTNEAFDMGDVVSRLKNVDMESSASGQEDSVVSYGVEDDKGNIMRITVRAHQAKEFEETLATQLADNKENKKNGINLQGNSLAEILYNLRDTFEIITVDFPIIPKDVVYNADMASKAPAVGMATDEDAGGDLDAGFDNFDQGADLSADSLGGDAGSDGLGDDLGDDLGDGTGGADDGLGGDLGGDTGLGGGTGDDLDLEGDNVEDFSEDPAASDDQGSILQSIISMLKAQANAQEATSNAAAEEARAKQSEWSAIAADKEVRRQEELARVDAQYQAQKKKDKEAKKYADLARFNVEKAQGGMRESFLMAALKLNEDQFDDPRALQKQKDSLTSKYQLNAGDSAETKIYKQKMYKLELTQLDSRIAAARLTAQFNADNQAQNQNNQQQQNPNQQQQPQPNQNAPVPNTAAPSAGQGAGTSPSNSGVN